MYRGVGQLGVANLSNDTKEYATPDEAFEALLDSQVCVNMNRGVGQRCEHV